MRLSVSLTLLTLAVLSGCNQGTPGGPGTTDKDGKKPAYGQANDTFNLSVPLMASALQQGERTDATIGIKRAENFDEDVTLKFTDVPKGVTIEPANPKIQHGDADAKITFQVSDDSPLGEFKIKVAGHPTKGSDAQVEFKLTIAAKDTFTLNVPRLSPLKQGETQTVSIKVTRDKKFDQEIALNFGELPTGVTMEPNAAVLKRGDTMTDVRLTATDDAALGNFDIKVTGHPTAGADASNEFKINVVQK